MSTDNDHLEYWALERQPFSLAPCPDSMYLSKQHGECLLRLKYGVMSGKGGSLLVSENAGDGKTTVLQRLVADLPRELGTEVRTAFIDHPTLTPTQMLQEISRQLGIPKPPRSKVQALNRLREHLVELNEAGEKCVVIVDEGQMLEHRPDLLQELRILLNFCAGETFLLSFILSGQIALEGVIRGMPEFWQRLPVRFYLGNLDLRDTRDLVRHRLQQAGMSEGREIFTPDAYEEIYRASDGCPRVICSVADLSLVVGRSQLMREISGVQVRQAWADMEKKSSDGYHYYHFVRSGTESELPQPGAPQARSAPQRPASQHASQQASQQAAPQRAPRPAKPQTRPRRGKTRPSEVNTKLFSWFRRP